MLNVVRVLRRQKLVCRERCAVPLGIRGEPKVGRESDIPKNHATDGTRVINQRKRVSVCPVNGKVFTRYADEQFIHMLPSQL